MHKLEKTIIELGIIDTALEKIDIDEWFEDVIIKFMGKDEIGEVTCIFKNCFVINLKHDKTYSKGKLVDGTPDYKYFVQDIEINENEDFYIIKISAWPLEGEIVCKKIHINV